MTDITINMTEREVLGTMLERLGDKVDTYERSVIENSIGETIDTVEQLSNNDIYLFEVIDDMQRLEDEANDAQTLYEDAKERADELEEKVSALEDKIEKLENELREATFQN